MAALRRTAYLKERLNEPGRRAAAFRAAAGALLTVGPAEVERLARQDRLTDLPRVGDRTAGVAAAAVRGLVHPYLIDAEAAAAAPLVEGGGGATVRAALRGDLHSHSEWSDGSVPVPEMAVAALALGHDYLAMTDHSPRLTVARGLTAERLRQQLDLVGSLNAALAEQGAGIRVLTGIEVDILEDGSLDQDPDLLDRLDVVVASVHSKLAMDSAAMTRRMLAAVANPHTDVLGHCTGRLLGGRQADSPGASRGSKAREESRFDAAAVFATCAEHGVAVEINSRPERLDPPMRLLELARGAGCVFSIDTDAHAPGQLEWQWFGCARAEQAGIDPDQIMNTWSADRLLTWTARPRQGAGRAS
ncbi:MAG: PHP domain-containing protein [Kineosporiaceae bacterium]